MLINNFEQIDKFIEFEPNTFYKFECLVRNTDGENTLFENDYSNTNKNVLIKSWYVDNEDYYQKIKKEMTELCNKTGARLYITLDRKSTNKLIKELMKALVEFVFDSNLSIKSLNKLFASKTSVEEVSDLKTYMFDVDTKDVDIKKAIEIFLQSQSIKYTTLNTKKGYHIVAYRKFNPNNWQNEVANLADYHFKEGDLTKKLSKDDITDNVSLDKNQLGLVYFVCN